MPDARAIIASYAPLRDSNDTANASRISLARSSLSSNSEIGMKGMLRAAEVMALSCVRVLDQPDVIAKAREELLNKNGGKYTCPLPEYVTPPIGRY